MLPQYGIWLGVSADSLREASHPTEYEVRTILGGGGGKSSLVWSCAVMVLGSRSPWGYLEKNKSSFRHGPGGVGVPGGTWGRKKIASVMALGIGVPGGYLGKNKNSFRHGPGESESPGILEE